MIFMIFIFSLTSPEYFAYACFRTLSAGERPGNWLKCQSNEKGKKCDQIMLRVMRGHQTKNYRYNKAKLYSCIYYLVLRLLDRKIFVKYFGILCNNTILYVFVDFGLLFRVFGCCSVYFCVLYSNKE